MTMIHECDSCGYEGRVIEVLDSCLCESCFEQQRHLIEAQPCPECGKEIDTDIGLCQRCANDPEIMPQPDC
ncbi:DUF7575 domain-containing protein [Pseudomonas cedrina]|uniref:DUF7575 domain-containing protein n=1 Tax=Pseudomonas cedrina TaxID=651740 RepID=UPI003EDACBC7